MTATPPALELQLPGRGWEANLDLEFRGTGDRTRLVRRRHSGPLQVQRPFYPEPSGTAHLYILHPPGGIVGGDRLRIRASAVGGAGALITTPAATKFYRSGGAVAEQVVTLDIDASSALEWLPQETLVFGGARATSRVVVNAEPGARFLGWEICCLGRPASSDAFESGSYRQRLEVNVGGVPACVDRARVESGSSVMEARFGLAGNKVFGSLVALGADAAHVEDARAALPPSADGDLFGVTLRRSVLVCRYLGSSVQRAREGFLRVWQALRRALIGHPAELPRIWAT